MAPGTHQRIGNRETLGEGLGWQPNQDRSPTGGGEIHAVVLFAEHDIRFASLERLWPQKTAVAMAAAAPRQQQQWQFQDAAGALGRLALRYQHICASSRPAGASFAGATLKAGTAATQRQRPQQDSSRSKTWERC